MIKSTDRHVDGCMAAGENGDTCACVCGGLRGWGGAEVERGQQELECLLSVLTRLFLRGEET